MLICTEYVDLATRKNVQHVDFATRPIRANRRVSDCADWRIQRKVVLI